MCGYPPFGDNAEEPYEIYDEIMNKKLTIPGFVKDRKAKRLLEQLLSIIPEARSGGSFAVLKSHAWFNNFDWVYFYFIFIPQDALVYKELATPFTPAEEGLVSEEEIEEARARNWNVIEALQKVNL